MEKAGTIVDAIVVISAIFMLVAAFLVSYMIWFNKKKAMLIAEKEAQAAEFQQQLLQSQIEVQEATYNVLSKELHDNIGQLLSTAKMLIGLAERDLPSPPDTLLTANATLGTAISELRSLSKSLDKEWLEQFSFTENLNAAISQINEGKKISASFTGNAAMSLPNGGEIILFRIVQEAIQNAVKHGEPQRVMVELSEKEGSIMIRIEDDGRGFDPTGAWGMGFINMNHRTKLLGGTVSWQPQPAGGTVVNIIIPLQN